MSRIDSPERERGGTKLLDFVGIIMTIRKQSMFYSPIHQSVSPEPSLRNLVKNDTCDVEQSTDTKLKIAKMSIGSTPLILRKSKISPAVTNTVNTMMPYEMKRSDVDE